MNNTRLINSIIENFKNENSLSEKYIFEYFAISQILKNNNIDFQDIDESNVDGSRDGGIDNIFIFVDDKNIVSSDEIRSMRDNKEIDRKTSLEILFIQSKTANSFKEDVLDKLIITFSDLFDYSQEIEKLKECYNIDLIEKIEIIRECLEIIMSKSSDIVIKTIYISKGDTSQISTGVKKKETKLISNVKNITNVEEVYMEYYGAQELRNIYTEPEDSELTLKCSSQIPSSFLEEDNLAYIVTVNLKDYYNFITKDHKIRENIFENNIRHFQGNVSVNKGIIDTLDNRKDTEFWWLNNGITMLVNQIVPYVNSQLKLKNIQIVNGLQTTFCIFEHFKSSHHLAEEEKRSVMIKIIQTNDLKITDNIISSTNSQTAVRPADLRATDNLQRDIEEFFLSKGYYYDRRKNFYKNQNKDRSKIFNIAKTAQYIETLIFKNPSSARSNPTSLLKTNDNYKKIFNPNIKIESYLNSCLIYKETEKFVKEKSSENDLVFTNYGASIKNFTFHLMLIATSIFISNYEFSDKDLANININDLSNEIFEKSVEILLEVIKKLEDINKIDNIINTAKSKTLSKEISKYFQQETSI